MAEIDNLLVEVERLIKDAKPAEAERRLRSLLASIGDSELRVWEVDIRRTIGQFLPKRRKLLTAALDEQLGSAAPTEGKEALPAAGADIDLADLAEAFSHSLDDLRDRHIFQWATYYRDSLSTFFDQYLDAARRTDDLERVLSSARLLIEQHACEVFERGYRYKTQSLGEPATHVIYKSVSGLQRFLDLPVEFYSAKLSFSLDAATAQSLRRLCASFLGGVLSGYQLATFGEDHGAEVLTNYPQYWGHVLPFLTARDLTAVTARLEPGPLAEGIFESVVPLAAAFDELTQSGMDYVPLPALSQMFWERRRLAVSLTPPPFAADSQFIEIDCYLSSAAVSRGAIEEAVNRNVAVVVAPLRPDLIGHVSGNERLSRAVVASNAGSDEVVAKRILSALEIGIYERRSPRVGAEPLRYNFAREFPLNNPFLTRYFHVDRSSVRELLRTFERRNGARLWCSVRRSGKTTSCLDLEMTSGESRVVTQTCEGTGQLPGGSRFYERVSLALDRGGVLSSSFFDEVVEECSVADHVGAARSVFVLDEYETLFGRLRTAMGRDPDLRYTVVQPLLNQMVAFTRENLLVFLGQQPDAHFIIMDQNQLSPYVEQDPFPLFRHSPGTTSGEFSELLRKVLTERVQFGPDFADAIFHETAGHPFLTVNLLVELVDMLIEHKRAVRDLFLDAQDADDFVRTRLDTRRISLSSEFAFFRQVASEATGAEGRTQTPWLHAIYSSIREIARASAETMTCNLPDFERIVESLDLQETGLSTDEILSTGQQANFLEYGSYGVRPRIRLLGRIAGASRPRVAA